MHPAHDPERDVVQPEEHTQRQDDANRHTAKAQRDQMQHGALPGKQENGDPDPHRVSPCEQR